METIMQLHATRASEVLIVWASNISRQQTHHPGSLAPNKRKFIKTQSAAVPPSPQTTLRRCQC
eukprot:1142147-Pelagomonas_calceolata.AAC.6